MKQWINRTVGFKASDPEEMELLEWSRNIPNFTEIVKRYLRHLRTAENGVSRIPRINVQSSREIAGNHNMVASNGDVEQFF